MLGSGLQYESWLWNVTLLGGAFNFSAAFGLPNFCCKVNLALHLLSYYAASIL